jgi:hypothetical protein
MQRMLSEIRIAGFGGNNSKSAACELCRTIKANPNCEGCYAEPRPLSDRIQRQDLVKEEADREEEWLRDFESLSDTQEG